MCKVRIIEKTAKSALTKLKRKAPYGWDLNIYRGCQHGCQYCYALYSHRYLNSEEFFSEIHVKTNIVEQLDRQLSSGSWQREVINIGGVTDSYQPVEATYQLMPQILKLLIKYKTPAIISTKSDLIMRDYDLIDELSRITYVNIATTITTMDTSTHMKIEPGSSEPVRRFEVLRAFRKTNASTGLHLMPIIPYITDNENNFDSMFTMAADVGVHYVLAGTLYLRGNTRESFLAFIQKEYPGVYQRILNLYQTGSAGKTYKSGLYEKVNRLREKYGLSNSYIRPMREKMR